MKKVIAVACLLVVAGSLYARVWTDTKGRTLKGDLVKVEETTVTVKKDGWKIVKIPIKNLSEDDQAFIAKEREKLAANAARVGSGSGDDDGDAEVEVTSKVTKELKGKLTTSSGKRYKFTGSEPQYVAYYYSASW